jgi:hypothetical protein
MFVVEIHFEPTFKACGFPFSQWHNNYPEVVLLEKSTLKWIFQKPPLVSRAYCFNLFPNYFIFITQQ